VRSLDIASAVDTERLREIITDLVERSGGAPLRRAVEDTGDGVMAPGGDEPVGASAAMVWAAVAISLNSGHVERA